MKRSIKYVPLLSLLAATKTFCCATFPSGDFSNNSSEKRSEKSYNEADYKELLCSKPLKKSKIVAFLMETEKYLIAYTVDGDFEKVKNYLEFNQADKDKKNMVDFRGFNALYWAVHLRKKECAQILTEQGVVINGKLLTYVAKIAKTDFDFAKDFFTWCKKHEDAAFIRTLARTMCFSSEGCAQNDSYYLKKLLDATEEGLEKMDITTKSTNSKEEME